MVELIRQLREYKEQEQALFDKIIALSNEELEPYCQREDSPDDLRNMFKGLRGSGSMTLNVLDQLILEYG